MALSDAENALRARGLVNAVGSIGDAKLISPSAVAPAAAGSQEVQNKDIPPVGRALLATIGGPGFESNGTYTQRYNQPDFSDFSQHPNTYAKIASGPNRGLSSNAAGRYQFISTTWNDQAKKLGLKDFSPENQDAAAWNRAKEVYAQAYKGRDLEADLKDPSKLPQVAQALHSEWTSLPGGMEQGSNMKTFVNAYTGHLQNEIGAAPTPGPFDPSAVARGFRAPADFGSLLAAGGRTV